MRTLIGVVVFAALVILLSLAGESDRRDALRYEPVRAEIYASAPGWAARR